MVKHKIYNTWLLLNIKKFADKYNVPVLEHHKAWIEKDFNFPMMMIQKLLENEQEEMNLFGR